MTRPSTRRAITSRVLVLALALVGATVAMTPAHASEDTGSSSYVPVTQTRILDTGAGTGLASGVASGSVPAGHSITIQATGVAGVPETGVTAVALNLVARGPAASGYLVAHAAGTAPPSTSSLNYAAGQTVANLAVVPVSVDGKITIATSATTQIVGDLSGYYVDGAPAGAGGYRVIDPVRALDTRTGLGQPAGTRPAPVPAGGTVKLRITGANGIPADGVAAVAVDLVAARPAAGGYLVAYADRTPTPTTSSLNYAAGRTVSGFQLVAVGADGSITIRTSAATAIVADVTGYVEAGTPTADGGYTPVTPTRIQDTRGTSGVQPAGRALSVNAETGDADGVPFHDVAAVHVVVTVVDPAASGYLLVAPLVDGTPATSTLNFGAGRTTANSAIVPVSRDGLIEVLASASTHLLVDVVGYVGGPAYDAPSPAPVSGLTATSTRANATLTWSAPATPGASTLMVRRSLGSTPPSTIVAGSLVARLSPTATGYVDSSVSPQNTYSYSVFAYAAPLWSAAVNLKVSTPLLTWAPYRPGAMYHVSCASSTMCVALSYNGAFTRFTGSTWTTPRRIATTVTNTGSVSCPRTNFCLTIDRVTGVAWSYDGATWHSHGTAGKYLGDIVCSSPTACVAEGGGTDHHFHATIMSGTVWKLSPPAPSSSQAYDFFGMSCASGTCVFVASYINGSGSNVGRLFTLTGSTWRSVATPTTYGGYDHVSCYSTALCYVLGQFDSAVYRNGHVTGLPKHTNSDYEGGVSCVSSTTCVVGLYDGTARVYNGTSLGATASVVDTSTKPQPSVLDVSCVGPTFCAAVGFFGVTTTTP